MNDAFLIHEHPKVSLLTVIGVDRKLSSFRILKTSASSLAIEKSKAFLCLDPLYESSIFSFCTIVKSTFCCKWSEISWHFVPFQDRGCFHPFCWALIESFNSENHVQFWRLYLQLFITSFPVFNFSVLFFWDGCPSDVRVPGIMLVFSYLFLLFPSLCHCFCFLGVLFNFIFLSFNLVFHFCHQAFTFSKSSFFLRIFLLYNILLFNRYCSL